MHLPGTHRGQSLHIGTHQTEVSDHIQDPVVGCKVERSPSILGRERKIAEAFFMAAACKSLRFTAIFVGRETVLRKGPGSNRTKQEALAPTEASLASRTFFKYFEVERLASHIPSEDE